jgi:regulator of protease activity HflC (stomatin/prohibitin superfamily)
MKEKLSTAISGVGALLFLLALLLYSPYAIVIAVIAAKHGAGAAGIFLWVAVLIADLTLMAGLVVVQPNHGVVLQLFGRYVGTIRQEGLRFTSPFYSKKSVSLRIRNFETNKLKVNDQDGNPVEIASVVVWKVVDTAQAMFQVDSYENYVHVQSEAAVRNLATAYPYDSHEDHVISLRGHTATVAEHLKKEIHERLEVAGVDILEARISHLAYAPEIAAAMLQRQQAGAIIAARQKIVEGAVGMVEMALELLARNKVVTLDEERRAAMVSNLLVVLCGERATQPVVNTGTIYH